MEVKNKTLLVRVCGSVMWQWLDLQISSLCRRLKLIFHQKIRGEKLTVWGFLFVLFLGKRGGFESYVFVAVV